MVRGELERATGLALLTMSRSLNKAFDLGLNFVDTALGYGEGHSERLIGQVRKKRSEPIFVATKIPPKNGQWPAQSGVPVEKTFPAEHVIVCTEESLKNLGSEAIDVQQFHVWSDEWVNRGDWLEAVQKLKEQGKIRFFGVSINDFQPDNAIKLIETGVVDTVQVIYNIFEQSPADRLLAPCEHHHVGVIVRVALDEGGLTGKSHRMPHLKKVISATITSVVTESGRSMNACKRLLLILTSL
jgi:aryl-alcohol dehydrogenase-like predicted oxidoreductase